MTILTQPLQHYADSIIDLSISCTGDLSLPVTGVSADSRNIRPGWLFCALPGARVDGAEYITAAISAGAVAVVSEKQVDVPAGVAFIVVRDAHEAAGRLAACMYGNPASRLRLSAVTGTNGKTTVAFLLREILRQSGLAPGMLGTVEYDLWGEVRRADRTTPTAFELQSLLRAMADHGARTGVLEVSSHALVQKRLGPIRFEGAIFTNLTGDHLDYHGSLENYYQAKKRLFTDYLAPSGLALINIDDPLGARLAHELGRHDSSLRLRTVGEFGEPDARITKVKLARDGCSFTLCFADGDLAIRSPLIGRYNVSNLAVVAALAKGLGIVPTTIVNALLTCTGAPGRLQAVETGRGFTVYVDYAHTDDALRNVLEALRELQPRQLAVVFGCGGDRDRTKRPRMGRMAAAFADRVYVTSDNPRSETPETIIDEIVTGIPRAVTIERIVDRRQAIFTAVNNACEGDIILVAGKGHEDYQEIMGKRYEFDDVLVVKEALAQDRP